MVNSSVTAHSPRLVFLRRAATIGNLVCMGRSQLRESTCSFGSTHRSRVEDRIDSQVAQPQFEDGSIYRQNRTTTEVLNHSLASDAADYQIGYRLKGVLSYRTALAADLGGPAKSSSSWSPSGFGLSLAIGTL